MLLLSGYDLVLCSDLCPRYLWRELTFCRYDSESLPERLKLCSVNRHFSCFSIIIRHFCWLHCLFLHLSLSEDLQQHLFLAVVKSVRTGMLPQSCNLLVLICFRLLFSSFFLYFSKHLFFFLLTILHSRTFPHYVFTFSLFWWQKHWSQRCFKANDTKAFYKIGISGIGDLLTRIHHGDYLGLGGLVIVAHVLELCQSPFLCLWKVLKFFFFKAHLEVLWILFFCAVSKVTVLWVKYWLWIII